MMNKNQIINDIVKEQIIEKCSTTFISYIKEEYRQDFIQDMYCQILSIDDEKLIELYNKKQLNYYILSICKNNAVNPKSSFWRQHKNWYSTVYIDENLSDKL